MMTEKQILSRIYPSVITFETDWRKMIKEVEDLKLKKISLFLTGAGLSERKKIYRLLEKTSVKEIPHVHLRHGMSEKEIDYLAKRYKSRVFTLHYRALKPFEKSKYRRQIFVENNWREFAIKDYSRIKNFGGLCLDLSHLIIIWHDEPGNYAQTKKAVKIYKIGCNHISEIKPDKTSNHHLKNLSDLDYLAKLPQSYFSRYLNIELTNSIKEQLECKKYIAKLLCKSWR